MILTPNRELAVQISDHLKALGSRIGLKTAVILGGIDLNMQVKQLKKNPHVVIGTPENIPIQRHTYLFSATMTNKVEKLERASLKNPIKIEASKNYETVQQLIQYYILIPSNSRDFYLYWLIKQITFKQSIIFVNTCLSAIRICYLLRKLGFRACTINGKISQTNRLGAIAKFRNKEDQILVATDVASRGLDIPGVDLVINYDLPMNPKDYIHRVGRTARAGRSGQSISFITQYNAETFLKIQELIQKKLQLYGTNQQIVLSFQCHVQQANRAAIDDLKDKLEDNQPKQEDDVKFDKRGKIMKKIRKTNKTGSKNKHRKKFINI